MSALDDGPLPQIPTRRPPDGRTERAPWVVRREDALDDDRRTAALAGFLIVLALAVTGVILVRDLGDNAALEDCLLAGRTNCAPIDVPPERD